MHRQFVITNARILTPEQEIHGYLRIADDRIEEVGPGNPPKADAEVIDAGGRTVFPGFIDIHSHGAKGHDTSNGTVESIHHIARQKLAEGVTTWLPTTMTLPPEFIKASARAVAGYRENPTGARVPGLHIEGPFLNPDYIGAQNPAHLLLPDIKLVEEIRAIAPILILSLAVELPGACDLIRHCRQLGIVTSCAHSGATYPQFLEAKASGLTHLTHFCNQMSPLHHRDIGLVGAGLLDPDVRIELICDGLHVSDPMLAIAFRCAGPGRILLITDSIEAAWQPDGTYILGGLEIRVQDGQARIPSTGTLAGTTLKFNDAVARAATISQLPLTGLARMAATNQADSCGLTDRGRIAIGQLADLAILNHDFTVWKTVLAGEVVFQADPAA